MLANSLEYVIEYVLVFFPALITLSSNPALVKFVFHSMGINRWSVSLESFFLVSFSFWIVYVVQRSHDATLPHAVIRLSCVERTLIYGIFSWMCTYFLRKNRIGRTIACSPSWPEIWGEEDKSIISTPNVQLVIFRGARKDERQSRS